MLIGAGIGLVAGLLLSAGVHAKESLTCGRSMWKCHMTYVIPSMLAVYGAIVIGFLVRR
jgi:hypothetical protein